MSGRSKQRQALHKIFVILFSISQLFVASSLTHAQDTSIGDLPPSGEGEINILSHLPRVGSSPFAPPEHNDTTFIVDDAPGLDTGCTFRSGGPLIFNIEVNRYPGDINKLKANGLISDFADLRMPAFDVDFFGGGGSINPERDRVSFNGNPVPSEFLTGDNNVWILNNFNIPIDWINFPSDAGPGGTLIEATNIIRIDIDTANTGQYWCTAIDWAALSIEVARPVLTVHGIFSDGGTWEQANKFNWRQTIKNLGIPYETISMHTGLTIGLDSIENNASDIADKVQKLQTRWGVDRLNIVAHSKGGLDSRHYIESHPTVEELIQLGTPNAGSPLADVAQQGSVSLLGVVPTIIIDGLAAPAGVQLTTPYMSTYNLFHGPNPKTRYFSLAGDYFFGGLGIVDAIVQGFYSGPNDTIVPASSVHALGYATHLTYPSTGADKSAQHTSLTTSQGLYNRVSAFISRLGQPTPSLLASTVEASSLEQVNSSGFDQTATAANAIAQGEIKSHTTFVDIVPTVSFVLHHGTGDLNLTLRSPSGRQIDPIVATSDPSVEFEEIGDSNGLLFEIYGIQSPEVGQWTLEVSGVSIINPSGQEPYILTSILTNSQIQMQAETDQASYQEGDPIVIKALLSNNGAQITSASATAKVVFPDESFETLILADDGTGSDAVADDSIYTGRFINTTQAGLYRILVSTKKSASPAFNRDELLLAPVASSQSGFNDIFSDFGNDTDGDGLFDELVIDVGLDITASATYRVLGILSDSNGFSISTATVKTTRGVGPTTVNLRFDGEQIFEHSVDGPYTLSVVRLAEDDGFAVLPLEERTNAYTTTAYRYTQFQGSPILVPGTGSDQGIDTNGNGLFDQLEINLDVEILNPGFYNWSARLADLSGTELDIFASSGFLIQGSNRITFVFDGIAIGTNAMDGPYFLNDLLIFSSTNSAVVFQAYTTQTYSASHFEGFAAGIPPSAVAGGPYQNNEGETITLDASASYDSDGTIVLYEWDLDNDGEYDDATGIIADTVFVDNGSFTVGLKVTDDAGDSDTDTAQVTVQNVAPDVGGIVALTDPVEVGTSISFSADFTDPGVLDTHTAVWEWGDGNTSSGMVTETGGSGSVSDSHTYSAADIYTIKLTVTDNDGDSGESIFQYVVVYDPDGGFVTGGGWINSPEGAYSPDPSLTGKTNFGFVTKYKKGADIPTGNTEFQFKAGDLNFHSESYDWLVIVSAKAIFQGAGTINGSGNYGFMITAIDEKFSNSVDPEYLFRMKIWDNDTGTIVYDTDMGSADGAYPSTALSGGNIALHQVKVASAEAGDQLVVIGNPPADLLARLVGSTDVPESISIFLPTITR